MPHRGLRFVYAVIMAFSLIFAFSVVRQLDENMVLGNTGVVWLSETDGSATGDSVVGTAAAFAREHHAAVVRAVPDLREPGRHRHLYLTAAPGSKVADWLDDGYPAFSRYLRSSVHPMTDVSSRDPRGFYYVFGSADAEALLSEFQSLGLRGTVAHPLEWSSLRSQFSGTSIATSLLVVALAVITLTGSSVLLSSKSYAVQRLQGRSLISMMTRDLRHLLVHGVAAATVAAAVGVVALILYNGLSWPILFCSIAGLTAASLVVLGLIVHAAAVCLTCQVDLLRALKGELPSMGTLVGAYVVRIPALFLALSIATSVVASGSDVVQRRDSWQHYADLSSASFIRLNGSVTDELTRMDVEVGRWLKEEDRDGSIIVVAHSQLSYGAPPASTITARDVLLVNDTFLEQQRVTDPSGRRYLPGKGDDGPIRVLIPQAFGSETETILAEVPGLVNPERPDLIKASTMSPQPSSNGQLIFSYSTRLVSGDPQNRGRDGSLVRDPVIVVVPNGSKLTRAEELTSYASQTHLLFLDSDEALTGIAAHHLDTYVTALLPVTQQAAEGLRDTEQELRQRVFNLAVAATVLLISGVGVCVVHARKNAQSIFVKHLHGWSFSSIHRSLLVIEGLVAALLVAWLPYRVWQENAVLRKFAEHGLPLPFQPTHLEGLDVTITAALLLAEVGAVVLALVIVHRRTIQERAREA